MYYNQDRYHSSSETLGGAILASAQGRQWEVRSHHHEQKGVQDEKKFDEWDEVSVCQDDSGDDWKHTRTDQEPHNQYELPPYQEAYRPNGDSRVWGEKTFDDISAQLERAYQVVANGFTKNLFILPSGRNGRKYVEEMIRLTREWNERGPLMAVAGIAENLMPHLLLQRNVNKADKETKKKQNAALGRRLQMWESGKIDELLQEAQALQNRVRERPGRMSESQLSRAVAAAVFVGNIRGAAKLVEIYGTQAKGGRLALSPEVISELRNKHPPAEELNIDAVLEGIPPTVRAPRTPYLMTWEGTKLRRLF